MEMGKLIEYNRTNIFVINNAENKAGRLVPNTFYFSRKLYKGKRKWSVHWF